MPKENKNPWKWPEEESFEDKVKREMDMPVWERPIYAGDISRSLPVSMNPFLQYSLGKRIAF